MNQRIQNRRTIGLPLLLLWLVTPALTAVGRDAPAVRVNRVRFVGELDFSGRELQAQLGLKAGEPFSESTLTAGRERLLRFLQNDGYHLARIDSIRRRYHADSTRVDVIVFLTQGPRLRVGGLHLEGLPENEREVLDELRTREGDVFREARLQEDIERVIRWFEQRGYPYCRVEVHDLRLQASKKPGESEVDIRLRLALGPEVRISEIVIRGNKQTQPHVIKRELGLEEGERYDQRKVDRIASRLMKTGYFKWVNDPRLELKGDGSGRLLIELEEGRYNQLDGILGYNPAQGNQPGFLTGFLNVSFRNLFGTGRQLKAVWDRKDRDTQELQLAYLEPWVAGLPLNAAFDFRQLIRDTSYVERGFGLGLDYRFNESLGFGVRFSRVAVTPDSSSARTLGIPRSSRLNLAFSLTFNTVNHPLNPSRGVRYLTTLELARKAIDRPSLPDAEPLSASGTFNQKRVTVDLETFLSPLRWQVLALGVHGRVVTTDEPFVAIPDQYRLGGTRTLRGYREDQFRGERVAWANLEYRYLLSTESRLFAFVDAGYFFRVEPGLRQDVKVERVKLGYGLGLRVDTRLGYFGLDYAVGQDDSLLNGKVHISLINAF